MLSLSMQRRPIIIAISCALLVIDLDASSAIAALRMLGDGGEAPALAVVGESEIPNPIIDDLFGLGAQAIDIIIGMVGS